MYIPIMAFITYILLSTVLAGLKGSFHPELLGSIAVSAIFVVISEIVVLKIAMYLLNITNESQLLDLIAYSGYKFVGVIVTLAGSEVLTGGNGTGGWIGWTVFLYTFAANAFFLVSPLPNSTPLSLTETLASITEVCPSPRFFERSWCHEGRGVLHNCSVTA